MTKAIKYYTQARGDVMKIKKLNVSLVDMSESEDCDVFLAEMPSKGEIVAKITSIIEELEKRGISEIEEWQQPKFPPQFMKLLEKLIKKI